MVKRTRPTKPRPKRSRTHRQRVNSARRADVVGVEAVIVTEVVDAAAETIVVAAAETTMAARS